MKEKTDLERLQRDEIIKDLRRLFVATGSNE